MFRCARFPRVFVFVLLLIPSAFPQQPPTPANSPATADSNDKKAPARRSAMNLLEEVLAGTAALALPQNRLAIELQAFPTIAAKSQPRARALVNQMVGEFSQASSQSDASGELTLPQLRQERTIMTGVLAQTDPELALRFLTSTLPYVQPTSPKDEGPDDHDLLLQLATQIASHDPSRALQMAEQQLQAPGDLSPSLINLLDQVERGDSQSGAQLFKELVQRVKQADLVDDVQQLSFAASLLAGEFAHQSENGGIADDTLRSLAEVVATAASSPQFEENNSYALTDAWAALDGLVPTKASALRQQGMATAPGVSFQEGFSQAFIDARSNGDVDKVAQLIEQAPEGQRASMSQQAVWLVANTGDLERTRQIAQNLNPWMAANAIQSALRSGAVAAGEKGDFANARQLAAQVTDEDSRAILLSELGLQAHRAGKPRMAEEILGEASSLLLNHSAGTSAFAAQLAVAQAYLRVNPAQAIPLFERSASQLQQVLTAAAQLDGFLPDPHSFEGSELILNRGFLYQSLIQPYAIATADLATLDLPTARTLADRLPLPEARLMTELFVARGVLDEDEKAQGGKAGVQASQNQVPNPRNLVVIDADSMTFH